MAARKSVSNAIFATVVDNKAVVISCIQHESHLVLQGSTLQASIACNSPSEKVKSITFYPKPGEEGVIAIVIHAFSHRSGKYDQVVFNEIPVFLKLIWKQDGETKKPFIDLENPWYPADRIGQIRKEDIEVNIRGRRFSNYDHAHWNFNQGKNNPVFVKDGDLLCRYLWGTAHASDVLHAVVQAKVEPIAQKRVEQLTREVRVLSGNAAGADSLRKKVGELEGKIGHLLDTVEDFDPLYDKLARKIFKGEAVDTFVRRMGDLDAARAQNGREVPVRRA